MSPVRRRLDWDNATVSPDRISVPLDGSPDDYWLDRFHEARSRANQVRAREQLPHLQIELRDGERAAPRLHDVHGDQESVRRLLAALVDSANRAPRAA